MKTVAVFDFDGTLTTRDTLLLFIRYACGNVRFLLGFLFYSPLIVMMLFRIFPNWKAKERVFSLFFKGMSIEHFDELGKSFALRQHERIANGPVIEQLRKHLADGATVYVVSASMVQWVRPFLPLWTGTDRVRCLGTEPEVGADGRLTGHFLGKNCYGPEKVNRLLEAEPHRDTYTLYAYGDSNGDTEMLAFADHGEKVARKM